MAQEKEAENKKPQNQPVASVMAEVLKQAASDGEIAGVNLTQGKGQGKGAPKDRGGGNPGGGRGRGNNEASVARSGRGRSRGMAR